MSRAAGRRTWTQITWVAPREQVELLEAVAGELGALSVSSEDAVDRRVDDAAQETWLETTPGTAPPWARVRVRALFEATIDPSELQRTVARWLGEPLARTSRVRHLEDRDWPREWMQYARPLHFGARLWVCPTSASLPDTDAGAVLLRLDPGLGFGTGSHESTALCLEWLESQALAGRSLIDYGCGSGILGIAALLLGAAHVRATDIDARALDATRDNVRRNDVAARLWSGLPEHMPGDPADVIVANIMADTLCALAPAFQRQQPSQGELVLSGILASQAESVERAFAPAYDTTLWRRRRDWVLLHARRLAE